VACLPALNHWKGKPSPPSLLLLLGKVVLLVTLMPGHMYMNTQLTLNKYNVQDVLLEPFLQLLSEAVTIYLVLIGIARKVQANPVNHDAPDNQEKLFAPIVENFRRLLS